ncbi:MAG: efflux RND transporter periplasmic adaptor subunit, partial [Planctomycetota bacterium]
AVTYFEAERTADPTTKTYAVTFTMPAPKPGLILPGMSATLQGKIPLDIKDDSKAFYLPVNAVFSGPGSERFVWVQDPKTARVTRREVTVGSMADGNIQVLTGLAVGDIVATSGVYHLRDGMKVRPLVFQARRATE